MDIRIWFNPFAWRRSGGGDYVGSAPTHAAIGEYPTRTLCGVAMSWAVWDGADGDEPQCMRCAKSLAKLRTPPNAALSRHGPTTPVQGE